MTEPQLIQPTGFYVHLSSDWQVDAVSANLGDFLPATADQALGQPVTALLSEDVIHDVRNRMALLRSEDTVEHLLRVSLSEGGKLLDLSIFRDGDGYGIDAEPSDGHVFGDATAIVDGMVGRVGAASGCEAIANEAARQLRALTGFDRVIVVGGGQPIGESIRPGQNRIDQPSATSNPSSLAVTDVTSEPVSVLLLAGSSAPRSTLRTPYEGEVATIRSFEAKAALIVPLLRNGQPWGHIGCFHGSTRHVGVERRGVAALFARFIGLQLEIAELRDR